MAAHCQWKQKLPQKNKLLRELRARGRYDSRLNNGPRCTHGMEDEVIRTNLKKNVVINWHVLYRSVKRLKIAFRTEFTIAWDLVR